MRERRQLGTVTSVLQTVNVATIQATDVCRLLRVTNWRSIPIGWSFCHLDANLPSTSVTETTVDATTRRAGTNPLNHCRSSSVIKRQHSTPKSVHTNDRHLRGTGDIDFCKTEKFSLEVSIRVTFGAARRKLAEKNLKTCNLLLCLSA